MRLLLDVTSERTSSAGVRRYVRGLRRALECVGSFTTVIEASAPLRGYSDGESRWDKLTRHVVLHTWYQVVLPIVAWRHRIDVIVCPEYYCPLFAPCPRIVVFHDALFWHRPEYPLWWRVLLRFGAVLPARRATAVIAPSAAVSEDVSRVTGHSVSDLAIIPPVVEPRDPLLSQGSLTRFQIPGDFLLHIGALEKRKELPGLIRAYSRAREGRETFPSLVLVGPRSPIPALDDRDVIMQTIAELDLQGPVVLTGAVDDITLAAFLSNAVALVFPSPSEGFGIPLVEAMAAGLPVIAVSTPATREVTSGAAVLVAQNSEAALGAALRDVVDDATLRQELIVRGKTVAMRYTLSAAVERIESLLKGVKR